MIRFLLLFVGGFVILFALPLDKAISTMAERNPEKLVELVLSRMGIGDVAQGAASAADWMRTPKVPDGLDV